MYTMQNGTQNLGSVQTVQPALKGGDNTVPNRYNLRVVSEIFRSKSEAEAAAQALVTSEQDEIVSATWKGSADCVAGVVNFSDTPKAVLLEKAKARMTVDAQHDIREFHKPTSKAAELQRERVALEQEVATLRAELAAKQA